MTEQLLVESSQLTDQGQKRHHNEDYVGFFEPDDYEELSASGRLYIVADGVGGAASGELASQYAVQKILYHFYNDRETDLQLRLERAVEAANDDIYRHNARHQERRGMATTIVAALIHDEDLIVANVGDSRAYLVREEAITQLTRDHSLVAEMVRKGAISEEEAEEHPRRNVILRSLGMEESVSVDVDKHPLLVGDIVVLCSDGLTRHVADEEIARVVRELSPQKAVRRLVDLANVRGGKDNISASVTRVGWPLPAAARPAPGGGELTRPRWEDSHDAPKDRPSGVQWLNVIGMGIGAFLAVLILGLLFLGPYISTPADRHTGTPAGQYVSSETPVPASATSVPTETSIPPTATPGPTDTPLPPTATPAPPTDTPLPTDTPAPPTDTPVPTATPVISAVGPFEGVVNSVAKVRKGPGLDYEPVLQIYPGTNVTVTSVATNSVGEVWFLVEWGKRPPGFRDTWLLSGLVEERP
jgi:serine/threonine protein phosphatase PrpC